MADPALLARDNLFFHKVEADYLAEREEPRLLDLASELSPREVYAAEGWAAGVLVIH